MISDQSLNMEVRILYMALWGRSSKSAQSVKEVARCVEMRSMFI